MTIWIDAVGWIITICQCASFVAIATGKRRMLANGIGISCNLISIVIFSIFGISWQVLKDIFFAIAGFYLYADWRRSEIESCRKGADLVGA